ncbi:hypothetical protein AB0D68_11160 [Streptomyces sp. NPDC048212]|uniref:hypothetical protein n=1 Tax=Streptomyces sp. NPDC048212 TaxID=3156658 RepID=UPI0034095C11
MDNVPYDPTHPVYEIEAVIVPAKGKFLVQDGKVLPAVEVSLFDVDSEYMKWSVWTDREEEED